jgi:hypothetical protein
VKGSEDIYQILVSGREDEPFGVSVITVAELLHGVEPPRSTPNTQACPRLTVPEIPASIIYNTGFASIPNIRSSREELNFLIFVLLSGYMAFS